MRPTVPAPDRPPHPRAVVLDWDNTLVDSWRTIHAAMNAMLTAMGRPRWSPEETRARVRRSLREAFPDMFGPRWEEARDIYLDAFRAIHLDSLRPLPGAAAMLEALAGLGAPLSVLSNKTGPILRREVAHLGWGRYFRRVVGAADAPADKPAMVALETALAGSGVAPGPEVWLVGDTWIDVQCAKNAGCTAVLVGEASDEGPESRIWRPDWQFRDCNALATLARGLPRPILDGE